MLAEFIKEISNQSLKAAGINVVQPAPEPQHVYFTRSQDGVIERREAEPAPRHHTAGDVASVIDITKRFTPGQFVCVWYDRTGITAVLDDRTRRDKAHLPLKLSPQMRELVFLEKTSTPMSQAQFVLKLRTLFHRCLGHAGEIIRTIRSVKFRLVNEGSSVVDHGKASLGKRVESELTGADVIPEHIVLEVPIFEAGALTMTQLVTCAIEIDNANEKFSLIPIPGDCEMALFNAEQKLGKWLRADLHDSVPIHYGQP